MPEVTFLRRILTLVSALTLTACTSINRLESTDTIEPDLDAIVVLGVSPAHYRIQIFPGTVKDGVWRERAFGYADFYGAAVDGYVIARVENDAALAIARLDDTRPPPGERKAPYYPCGDTPVIVFSIPKGKAVYLSDFEFGPPGKRFKFSETADLARATRWLDEKYPALRGRLEQGTFEALPTPGLGCQGFWPFSRPKGSAPEPTPAPPTDPAPAPPP
jgi:hypothetical protein